MITQNSIMIPRPVRNQLLISSTVNFFFRYCASTNKKTPPEDQKKTGEIDKKQKGEFRLKLQEYLQSVGSLDLYKEAPLKHWVRTVYPQNLYLFDRKIAKEMTSLIEKDIVNDRDCFLAELAPGLGILTESLLTTSIPKLHLFESYAPFLDPNSRLKKLIEANPERLELRTVSLLKLWQVAFRNFRDGKKDFPNFFKGVKKKRWDDEPCIKIIGCIPNENFVKHLMMSAMFQNTFMEMGRVVSYLAMSPFVYERFAASKNTVFYKQRSIIFQILFNFKKLSVFPRKSFLPWCNNNMLPRMRKMSTSRQKLHELNEKYLYFVKIEPKADLSRTFTKNELFAFLFFITQNMKVKKTPVISTLEKWVPGCGVNLIAKDYNRDTLFSELEPSQLIEVFKVFSSSPDFEAGPFMNFALANMSSLEESLFYS